MKKLIAATAMTMLFAGSAFADTNAANTRTALDAYNDGDTSVADILMDSEGNDRTDEDFMARWDAATPEQQAALVEACDRGQEEELEFTDTVKSRCKVAAGN
ncbi:hypothetical protein [Hoeflea sp.]|uniref:hypothetical protein n=1 Tax=Hoeflea sp. TaxID=1940281 RepID=UPI003B5204C1